MQTLSKDNVHLNVVLLYIAVENIVIENGIR